MSRRTLVPQEDISKWVGAVKAFVKETNVSCLDLRHLGDIPISVETVQSILKYLPESQVTELILDGIELCNKMEIIREYVKTSQIKKLSVKNCKLLCSDVLDLAEVLNDTKIDELNIISMNYNLEGRFDQEAERKLGSYLVQSRLMKLSLDFQYLGHAGISSFAEGLPSCNLTSLHIKGCLYSSTLASLFSQLPDSQITDLGLYFTFNGNKFIKELSQHLPESKINKLSLVHNKLSDVDLDVLAQGLVSSSVTELNLSGNNIAGSNNFWQCISKSKLRVLDLSYNNLWSSQMFAPNVLKASSLESLDVSTCLISDEIGVQLIRSLRCRKLKKLNLRGNEIGRQSITELVSMLTDTSLEGIDLSYNDLPIERFDLFTGCVKDSILKDIRLNGPRLNETNSCLRFLEVIKNSSVRTVNIPRSDFIANDAELFAQAIRGSMFTHFNLRLSNLTDIFSTLVLNLKYTSITHLNLQGCRIIDVQVQLLSEHLDKTKILELNLSDNGITIYGAIVLAKYCPQTSLIHLNLGGNKIVKEGLEIIAGHFTGTLITTFKLINCRLYQKGRRELLLIKKVLLENQLQSHKLVVFFHRVLSQNNDTNFSFQLCVNDNNVQEFFEECLQFYKQVSEKPAVVSVLLEEPSLSFSREEIVALLFDKFPRQLVEFIGTSIEADVWQLVKLLKRAEELGLVRIVKDLLLLRPLLMIDEAEGIMHPYVYDLLFKYELPICNESIEPGGIERVKEYFTAHSNFEGAEHLVNLLSSNDQRRNPLNLDCK